MTNLDAFERLRVSNPTSVFDCKLEYDLQPLLMETVTAGSGSATHDASEGACKMTVTTADGDSVIRQSRRYCTYQPGKSQAVFITGALCSPQASTRCRMGYFDDANGVFLEQDGTSVYLVFRSSVSGSPVDTRIARANWNVDAVDGVGRSKRNLDFNKSMILVVDLQWLGVGRVRVGFDTKGQLTYVHEFYNDNINSSTYWTTANLPVRYEITNTGTAGAGATMRQICCSVQSEGGFEISSGFPFAAVNSASIGVTTRRPILSIRPKLTFNSIANRMGVIPIDFEAIATTNNAILELVYNANITGGTAPSWTSADANSGVEFDVASDAISGGTVIWKGFVTTTAGPKAETVASSSFPSRLWLTLSEDGTASTPLSLVATAFTGTSNLQAAIRWVEIR